MTIAIVMVVAGLYGLTMKTADLLDEHGLKLFRGANLVAGVLWGIFGSWLILTDRDLGNILLAQIVTYLVRGRLDYLNHRIGATIMIITFLIGGQFQPFLFGIFGVIFLIFGSLRDYIGNVRDQRDFWYWLNEPAWYYVIPPFVYSLVTGNWLIFGVLAIYRASYNSLKYLAPRLGWVKDA